MNESHAVGWLSPPLQTFVRESGVQLAVLMRPSGQVIGQYGFTSALDVMSACSLGAAIYASAGELGRLVNGEPFVNLYHAGDDRQIFLGQCETRSGRLLLLAIFGQESSVGLVQLFFDGFRQALGSAVARTPPAPVPAIDEDFDRALAVSLDALFSDTRGTGPNA